MKTRVRALQTDEKFILLEQSSTIAYIKAASRKVRPQGITKAPISSHTTVSLRGNGFALHRNSGTLLYELLDVEAKTVPDISEGHLVMYAFAKKSHPRVKAELLAS